MVKKIAAFLTYCCCLFFSDSLFAGINTIPISDTSASQQADTGKTRAFRLTNKSFNEIYIQNLRPTYFGQEFFDPHKTLLVSDLTANFILFDTPKSPFFFVAVSRVNLRLFAAHGSPVKSPSYMPGGTLYYRLNNNTYKPAFLTLAYSHHSNGIEGPTLNPDGTINTDSGKFTTNFYTLTYHAGKRTDKENMIINRYEALGLELHSALLGLGYAHALKGKYGFVRVNGNWMYNVARATGDAVDNSKKDFVNWQRLLLEFTYIADTYNDYSVTDIKKRLNISLKYYYQLPFMQNVSFLLGGGYRGQDEYNIFFQDSYPYVFAGFAAGLSFDFRK